MITRFFARSEFACRCGCGLADPHPALVMALHDLRTIIRQPLTITSGSRCEDHNRRVGGAPGSYHLPRAESGGYTMAADVRSPMSDLALVVDMAQRIGVFGGLSPYLSDSTWWLHLDVRGVNGSDVPTYRQGWVDLKAVSVEAVVEEEARRRRNKEG